MRGPDKRRVGLERKLRSQPTDAEMKLWLSLRDRRLGGFKFVRQEAIESYVVDFVCRERRLIIEVDGGQHADSQKDRERIAFCQKRDIACFGSGITMRSRIETAFCKSLPRLW